MTTSRDEAAIDPFKGTVLEKMDEGVQEIVRRLHEAIKRSSPPVSSKLWVGSGYRTGSKEHQSGRAIDIVITAETGMRPDALEVEAGLAFTDWIVEHADELKVEGIIFSRNQADHPWFWGYSRPGEGWRESTEKRKNVSDNHIDHVHILFKEGATWPESLNGVPVVPRPGLPNTGDGGDGPHIVDSVSVSHLKEARYSDPDKEGTPIGPYGNEVFTLETALARTEWLKWEYVDGHYGTSTVGDGSSGYGGTTGFQRKHTGASDPDGWLGPKELATLFDLAGMSISVTS